MVSQFATTLLDETEIPTISAGPIVECKLEPVETLMCAAIVDSEPIGCGDEAHR
jgi:hypothetical protein